MWNFASSLSGLAEKECQIFLFINRTMLQVRGGSDVGHCHLTASHDPPGGGTGRGGVNRYGGKNSVSVTEVILG